MWKKSEIDNVLGEHAPIFEDYFGVEEKGNIDPAHDAHDELTNQVRSVTATWRIGLNRGFFRRISCIDASPFQNMPPSTVCLRLKLNRSSIRLWPS